MTNIQDSRFLRACRGEAVDATPLWLMRQAGRYMQEYRDLRKDHGILDIIKSPELAKEVTLQPINAFDLDAAIIFADILPPLEAMGLDLEFVAGKGPVFHNPVRNLEDAEALEIADPYEKLNFTLEAIKLVTAELEPRGIPLIGFAGAPFTLAYYAIEGQSSKNKVKIKSLMYEQPETWDLLMTKLAEVQGQYLLAQAEAGAHVLQLFDSWAGEVPPQDYREFVHPYSKKVIDMAKDAGVPIIHYSKFTTGMLEDIKAAGADVISVDWHIDIDKAAQILGDDVGIQGNLDPVVLHAPWPEIEKRTAYILDKMKGRDGFIFNLGHGIIKTTPPENVAKLAKFVHEYTKE